eukprot:3020288-Heterocapsa_arctica.AAC.1
MDDAGLKELFEKLGAISSMVDPKDDKGKPLYIGLDKRYEQRQEHLRQRFQPGAGNDGMDQDGPIPPMVQGDPVITVDPPRLATPMM